MPTKRKSILPVVANGGYVHRLSLLLILPAMLAAGPPAAATDVAAASTRRATTPDTPRTSAPFLDDLRNSEWVQVVQTARRAFEAVALTRPAPPIGYRPPRLDGRKAIVHLTARRRGKIIGEGESAEA